MDALNPQMAGRTMAVKPNGYKNKTKKRRPYRPRIRSGIRGAALRAFTGASLYKEGRFPTIAAAAQACGSNRPYIVAALIILDTENGEVQEEVLTGRVPLLAAARQLRRLAALVRSYRAAATSDLPMFGKIVGVADLFDRAIAPAL
jgi:hypothetical protein